MTRHSYRTIESRRAWSDSVLLSEDNVAELKFWAESISRLNGFTIASRSAPRLTVYSDASSTGFGGFVENRSDLRFHGTWEESERNKSSTWRELAAVFHILCKLVPSFSNKIIRWHTDNSNVPNIITGGSPKPDLQSLALSIFNLASQHNIILLPEWLPRSENKIADSISKFRDFDDWAIDSASFQFIERIWGPHTIDRFASPHNAKLKRFNARFHCKGACGVDAFCQDWSNENNYFCPPVSLIIRVVKHIFANKITGSLVVPHWPKASFWPLICPDGTHVDSRVIDQRLIRVAFTPPALGSDSVFQAQPSFSCLFLRFDFDRVQRILTFGFHLYICILIQPSGWYILAFSAFC